VGATPDSTDLKPVKTELPTYPNAAREQNIRGQVAIQILVSEAGDVEGSQVISRDPRLRDAALEAAKRWRFKPFLKGGQPVAAIAKLSFDFGALNGETTKSSADPWLVQAKIDRSGAMPKSVRVSSGVTQGLILTKVAPEYPESAKKARIQGSVVIAATINTEGAIRELRVVSGPPELVDAAVDVVRQWRYKPYFLMGRPIEVDTQVRINFILNVR
jgi:TonB family protein